MSAFIRSLRLTLTLRESSPIPLELYGVIPEAVAPLSLLDVAKLPVFYSNRREELGQFFDVDGDPSRGWIQFAGDTRNVKGIGAGMGSGTVYVENDAGMHAGARMTGGLLIIDSGAGDWLGAEMHGGYIEVRGDAGNQVGAAYRGSRRGMTGGVIWCRRSAGDETGLLMRRGLIVVEGDCGEFAGASMIAGSLFIGRTAGGRLGAGMKRGTIFANTVTELPPSFRYSCEYRPLALALYRKQLASIDCDIPGLTAGAVHCYRGDMLHGGRGEVFVAAGPGQPRP